MAAKDFSLTDLVANSLSFQVDEGKVFFKNRRAIILGADASGTLLKDLISVLGHERAKGFLLRFGWNCGLNDAKYMEAMFPWDDDLEWLLASPNIHSLEGTVLAVPIEIRANRETGEFYSEGYWHHSYEAEQHIKHFGFHHEPVCHTLIGYAGGYGSYFLGRKVIFKEVECVGKGDPYCRYIGKPIEEWGTEINDSLPLYKEENVSLELNKAYQRIEKQKEDLQNVLKINGKLSNVLVQGGGLSSIVRVLGESLYTGVIFEDKYLNMIASFGNVEGHEIINFMIHSEEKKVPWVHELKGKKKTVELIIPEQYSRGHVRLISPILLKNEIFGYLSLVKKQGSFNEMENLTLERAANICAIQILQERSIIEAEQRIKGEFINELLLESSNKESLLYQMNVMGYNLENPYYVFVFNIKPTWDQMHETEHDWMELRKEMGNLLLNHLNLYEKKCLVSTRLDQIIGIIPADLLNENKLQPVSFGELLVNILRSRYGNFKINLGISTLTKGIDEFRSRYEEANKSAELAYSSNKKKNVIAFDELGFLGILLHAGDGRQLENFAMKLLGDLVNYDKENNTELLKTMYVFLENQGNIHQSSHELNISVGGLRYRLKRVQEISHINIQKDDDLFDIHLALKILLFYRIFKV